MVWRSAALALCAALAGCLDDSGTTRAQLVGSFVNSSEFSHFLG